MQGSITHIDGRCRILVGLCAALAAGLTLWFGMCFGAVSFLLPFALLVLLLTVLYPRIVFVALFGLMPLSVPFSTVLPNLGADFWLPTEPIVALYMVLLLLSQRQFWSSIRIVAKTFLFLLILLYISLLVLSAMNSTLWLVSAKYVLVRLWFVVVFFVWAYVELKNNPKCLRQILWLYVVGVSVVAVCTMVRQYSAGLFDRQVAQYSCTPFFPDHTSYGAALAFALPMALALATSATRLISRLLALFLSLMLSVALVLSFTRAAWVGLAAGSLVWACCLVRMQPRTAVAFMLLLICAVGIGWPSIMASMRNTEAESTGGLQHLRSVTNITTDESNLERLNRWSCAWQMFRQKPLLGFGPGTYQFVYAQYQQAQMLTGASTNRGDRGNAHSEYIGLLAECGAPAALVFTLLVLVAALGGLGAVQKMQRGSHRAMLMGLLVGFTAYAIHSALNNFLDMDKLAAPFWLTMAVVAVWNTTEQSV